MSDSDEVDEKSNPEVPEKYIQNYRDSDNTDYKSKLEALQIACCKSGDEDSGEDNPDLPCFDASKLNKETAGHKIVEPELDFEDDVQTTVMSAEQKDTLADDHDDALEEGEADEGEVSDEDDLEEGEVKDERSASRKMQPRPICRFFNKGQCTWGTSCRFIHPGVNDKGNYNMFAPSKPTFGPNMMLPGPPPPIMMMMMMGPGHNYRPRMGMRGPEVPFPSAAEEAPPVESAWERGLRHAKEILKKASRRKEQEPDFEEKRMNMSIESSDKGPLDYDKENDLYGRSPPYRHSDSYNYGRSVADFAAQDAARYRDRSDKDRSRYQRSFEREKYEQRGQDDDRLRDDVPTRGDEWRDPWRRSKSPKGRSRSRGRGRSRRSYSSASSRSFSSRSSRSSYSYSRSSSSKSSYFSSDSYSKSRSRSPLSPSPRHYDSMRQGARRGRRVPFLSRSPLRTGRSPPHRSPRSPPLRAPRSPPLRQARSPPMRLARSPPMRPQPRSPPLNVSPVRVVRHKMSPDTTTQIPLPPLPLPSQQSAPPAKDAEVEIVSEARSGGSSKGDTRGRLPRNYSGSESSRSMSRSVSRSSSSASRSRSRSVGSYSRSLSMSSVSSASGSSSSESDIKKTSRSPSVKEVPVKPTKSLDTARKHEDKSEPKAAPKAVVDLTGGQGETERIKGTSLKGPDAVPQRDKRISMVLPKLHSPLVHTSQPAIVTMPKVSKDLLRQSGQKPQIKLTLLSKAPPPPSALEQSPTHTEVIKQKPVERVESATSGLKKDVSAATAVSRKRPLSPTITKAVATSTSKRSTTSRREELLKQLKAVEDAIARKRAKII